MRVPGDAAPARIREAVERVLNERDFRLAAQRVAKAIAGEDPVRAAVAEIESLVGDD